MMMNRPSGDFDAHVLAHAQEAGYRYRSGDHDRGLEEKLQGVARESLPIVVGMDAAASAALVSEASRIVRSVARDGALPKTSVYALVLVYLYGFTLGHDCAAQHGSLWG